ncbi:hypothetical protein [Cupriavidus consociatus]|uniref:hypothetical protein n=1 Tax=Cupriavidus consociatus TaxID=2821357 RepID=UPI001FD820D7|nr:MULTISPECIES: hypothetical protein [unclassified Cupriavidus]MDK2657576.1 hypothetical protein [Cupriavidus sp. LEh21]
MQETPLLFALSRMLLELAEGRIRSPAETLRGTRMCYSVQIQADYRKYQRLFGASVSLELFVELFWERRRRGDWSKLPKAMLAPFASPDGEAEQRAAELITAAEREQTTAFEAELFQQKTRLAGAERALATKPTKKAQNDQRIATDKIQRAQRNLADLHRSELLPRDSRVFPGYYAPVLVVRDGQLTVIPMRYQCRLPGWTAAMERQKPGTYNAFGTLLTVRWKNILFNQPLRSTNSFS